MLAQIIWQGYTIAEVSCPTKYFAEASSINLQTQHPLRFGLPLDSALLPFGQNGNHPFQAVSGEFRESVKTAIDLRISLRDDAYVLLKNYLYNYLLRRRAVRKCWNKGSRGLILEVGSGLSPMMEASERIVYSELSFAALRTLKRRQGAGYYVVADARIPPVQDRFVFAGDLFRSPGTSSGGSTGAE